MIIGGMKAAGIPLLHQGWAVFCMFLCFFFFLYRFSPIFSSHLDSCLTGSEAKRKPHPVH